MSFFAMSSGGGGKIVVSSTDFGNTSTTTGTSVTFLSKAVGSGAGRVIIILVSARRTSGSTGVFNSCTVDGNAAQIAGSRRSGTLGENNTTAGYVLALTAESGNVDIVLGSDESQDSWGMSYLILTKVLSTTQTDEEDAGAIGPTNSQSTNSALAGSAGGISVGVTCFGDQATTTTWGSLMTKRTDVSTGGAANDHRHSAAYDILSSSRNATETVSFSTSSRVTLTTLTFR